MARRTSPIEDLLTLVASAPWPVGVLLAIGVFVGLQIFLSQESAQISDPTDFGQALFLGVGGTLARGVQYVIPPMFLLAALVSFIKQRKKSRIFETASAEPTHGVASLSWLEFEELVGELFRHRGFSMNHSGKAGPDGGVDVELKQGGETFLVQCKHWRARKVPVMTVRELYGAMTAAQAAGGFVVTSGEFTADARHFATGRNIELVDGQTLASFLTQHGQPSFTKAETEAPSAQSTPQCPKCGAGMVQRVARQGALAGKSFWGCQSFPQCRGTRALSEG